MEAVTLVRFKGIIFRSCKRKIK